MRRFSTRCAILGLALAAAVGLVSGGVSVRAQDAAPAVRADFTDSSAAGLAATRRVVISSVIVSIQSSVAAEDGPGAYLRMFQAKETSQTVLALPEVDPALAQAIADEAYKDLAAKLTADGFEVVSQADLKASPIYGQILAQAGIPAVTRYANAAGDALLASPNGLPGYLPYVMEAGPFAQPRSYIGWSSAMGGKSVTAGGPSLIGMTNAWKIPGLEVQLAKSLNANVVKAFYVVTLGKATARRSATFGAAGGAGNIGGWTPSGERTVTGEGSAVVQVGLLSDQTRLAFRTPTGNAKWQKVSALKMVPAKDGDVVVRLAQSLEGGTDYFSVQSSSSQRGLFQGGADFKFQFVASLGDPQGWGSDVVGMIQAADGAMTSLLKP